MPELTATCDRYARYPTCELPLLPGSILALYTDGLIETPGVDLDDATAELAHQIQQIESESMDALADALLDQAMKSAPRHDDIALLLIRTFAGQ
ncbi:SpoIIE family protein phosphatase [Streptomyces sp. ID05-39B]|uniref:SpoIIE family protein phosphatase n=1 Tax=Streptomyces sp. ID05-39B TaxID=3028664 RepID=UPI0029B5296B|nr:SpoIIE family protein phosphatase [Streptomyces sp. ID05-39B]MDX3529083.1 SpoIIE family protein phosphatase [Streptomyces sp. ID05-39B]